MKQAFHCEEEDSMVSQHNGQWEPEEDYSKVSDKDMCDYDYINVKMLSAFVADNGGIKEFDYYD